MYQFFRNKVKCQYKYECESQYGWIPVTHYVHHLVTVHDFEVINAPVGSVLIPIKFIHRFCKGK